MIFSSIKSFVLHFKCVSVCYCLLCWFVRHVPCVRMKGYCGPSSCWVMNCEQMWRPPRMMTDPGDICAHTHKRHTGPWRNTHTCELICRAHVLVILLHSALLRSKTLKHPAHLHISSAAGFSALHSDPLLPSTPSETPPWSARQRSCSSTSWSS